MKHKIISALFATILFVSTYAPLVPKTWYVLIAIQVLAAFAYNMWYLTRSGGFRWATVRFALLEISIALLALVVPNGIRFLPLLISAVIAYFCELLIVEASEQLLFIQTLLTFFGCSLGIYAVSFYFSTPSTVSIAALFLVSVLVARGGFDPIPRSNHDKSLLAIVIGLCLAEIGWCLLLLPLHFTALAIIEFNVFYVLWMLSYLHFHHNLTMLKAAFHAIFSTVLVIVVLLATPLK